MEVELTHISLAANFLSSLNPVRKLTLVLQGKVQNGGGIYAEFECVVQTGTPTKLRFPVARILDGKTSQADAALAVKKRLKDFAAASEFIPQPFRQDILRAIGGPA